MSGPAQIVPGSVVSLHLRIDLEDGTEALSTFDEEPVDLVVGDGTLQPGLELAIYGLSPGDRQTLNLMPEQAYGLRDTSLIHNLPLSDFGDGITPEAGQLIAFQLPGGEETAGLVLDVADGQVEVDFNHPLAGHEIRFSVEILSVENPGAGTRDEGRGMRDEG
jgi:FKBP-type peptidyl-prolyl cis-trans isomerase SlpA